MPLDPLAGPMPKLEISPGVFDFGLVWQGQAVEQHFTVKNLGAAPLTLALRSSCGCIVAGKPESPLAAGATTSFTLSFDTRSVHFQAGATPQDPYVAQVAKYVTLTTNDPDRPELRIEVRGTVRALFLATPYDSFILPNLDEQARERSVMRLENKAGRPLKLNLRPDQHFDWFEVSLHELVPGLQYELALTTRPPLRRGSLQGTIELETDFTEVPVLKVNAQALVLPRIHVRPNRLIASPGPGGPVRQTLYVQYPTDQPITVTDVSPTADWIQFSIQPSPPTQPGARTSVHRILVTIPDANRIPDEGATIVISTDDPSGEFRRLTVPISKVKAKTPTSTAAPTPPATAPGGK